ncbi:MAG TPA: hypothetical protein VMV65_08650 [Alphaproteobacteria bacterium]|nr:hypothetical protein [Alphaproteobacteria bacterium]
MNDMVLAIAIAATGATRLEIDHVPNNVNYRTALSPRDVEERARIRVESRDPATVASIVAAIERTAVTADTRQSDLRYLVRLRDARGATRAVIYLDAFGERGVVDGRPVRFSGDTIKRAIVAAFPSLRN